MDLFTSLENIMKKTRNLKFKKDIRLLLEHTKLLYKYGKDKYTNSFYNEDFKHNPRVNSQLEIVVSLLKTIIVPYSSTIEREYFVLKNRTYVYGHYIEEFLEHCLDLLEIILIGEDEIEEGNVFLGIGEKLKRANKSARDGNSEGLFSNLHTIVELLFKDKLGIALDMDGARLGKVLSICIRHQLFGEKNNILIQLNNNICEVDNKIKHSGYSPTPKQMNDALLVATQAVRILKNETPEMTNEVKEEISKILIKNN